MTDRIYTTQDLSYVTKSAQDIKNYAALMGVSATAVAGAIAKEHSRYNEAQGWNQALDSYGALRMSSHASVAGSVMAANALGLSNVAPSPLEKMAIPALIDMGIANFKVTTAIGLLNQYYLEHPNSDPLSLNGYKGNYQNVVAELNGDAFSQYDLTAKLTTLMIKQGQDFCSLQRPMPQGSH